MVQHTDALVEAIRNRVAILVDMPPSAILDDMAFADLGVDSLMLLELVALVEQCVGCELPEADLGKLRSLNDVHEYVIGMAQHG